MAGGLLEPRRALELVGKAKGQKSTLLQTRSPNPDWPVCLTADAYPRDDKLSAKVLHFRLDFAADVELVAVQSDALEVGQQVLLAG